MAATNTYVDEHGDRYWKPGAVCPAYAGGKTCEQLLALGRRVQYLKRREKNADEQRPLGQQQHRRGGCSGYLYTETSATEPAECPTFQCGTCGKHVPWSVGCGDEYLDDCDDCAVKKMKKEGKL